MDCLQRYLYTESISRLTIDGCVFNGLMTTKPGKLIGTKFSFHMNHASVCGTLMATFMLDPMLVNAAFQSFYRTTQWPNTRNYGLGCDFVSWTILLRVISIPTGTSLKCYSLKLFPSSKASLDISLSRIMHMLQRLYQTFVQCTSSLANLFTDVSPIEYVWDLIGQRLAHDPNFAHTSNMEFFSTSRHSTTV